MPSKIEFINLILLCPKRVVFGRLKIILFCKKKLGTYRQVVTQKILFVNVYKKRLLQAALFSFRHSEHAAMRVSTLNFIYMFSTCLTMVLGLILKSIAITSFVLPCVIQNSISVSRFVRLNLSNAFEIENFFSYRSELVLRRLNN